MANTAASANPRIITFRIEPILSPTSCCRCFVQSAESRLTTDLCNAQWRRVTLFAMQKKSDIQSNGRRGAPASRRRTENSLVQGSGEQHCEQGLSCQLLSAGRPHVPAETFNYLSIHAGLARGHRGEFA